MLRPPWNHSHRELCHWRWKLGRLQSIHTRNRLEQFPGKIFLSHQKSVSSAHFSGQGFPSSFIIWLSVGYQSLPWSVSRRWEGLCMWENKRFAPSKNPLEIMNSVRSWRPLCRSGISCTPGERMSCPPKTQRKGENCHQREMNQISWNLDMVSGDLALA